MGIFANFDRKSTVKLRKNNTFNLSLQCTKSYPKYMRKATFKNVTNLWDVKWLESYPYSISVVRFTVLPNLYIIYFELDINFLRSILTNILFYDTIFSRWWLHGESNFWMPILRGSIENCGFALFRLWDGTAQWLSARPFWFLNCRPDRISYFLFEATGQNEFFTGRTWNFLSNS